ncbi:MAG TPA: sigma-70 family RNA polymerase sigma factor [Candidatus Sulfopaludibacter sp.]|jgi:RNA polymerase sigma factor (TIGR02999 family)|nr:sigma-70 family RNA polymerase sigma factor [Candidatus Sulfopaludibacter sp.]
MAKLEWTGDDKSALDRLTPFIYSELRRLAGGMLRRQAPGHTLQPTALVHEAYLRLVGDDGLQWQNRAHFFGIAAQCMRNILVDRARARAASKRGGDLQQVPLDLVEITGGGRTPEILDLDRALTLLATMDARKSRLVELRYFGGLTAEESAVVVGISATTVARELRFAEAWLHHQLSA